MAEEKQELPAGFRFHPTDEELITYYLLRKVSDSTFTSNAVAVVDLNNSEPWHLPGKARMGEKEWYFFSLKDRKYPTGLRTNRATQCGYWKTTGKDKEIFGAAGVLIGMKKTLVFYKGRAPRGEKTNWVMHEYRLQNKHHPFKSSKEEWVVCRVFQKSPSAPKKAQETNMSSPEEASQDSPSMINDFGDDAELPIININNNNNRMANSSSSSSCGGFTNNTMNNWPPPAAASEVPSLPWPSELLLLNPMNTLLLKALQLRNYHQMIREAAVADNTNHHFATYNNNSTIPQGFSHQPIGTTDLSSNINGLSVSASRVLECLSQQQEQSFNMAP